jgi:hypothetical protein
LILAAALIPAGCGKKGQGELLILPIFDRDNDDDSGDSGGGGGSSGSPTVTSVTVSPPNPATVAVNNPKTFSALVVGTNSPAQTVTWTVIGNDETGTVISSGGVLTVDPAEADGKVLTVIAESTVDTSTSGTATVTVGYAIGEEGPAGGKIFYVDSDDDYPGWNYLEAALADIPGDIVWAVSGTTYANDWIGGTETGIGSGKENTDKIVTKAGANAPAAQACGSTIGGFTDWFLPSKDELHEMYDKKEVIGGFVISNSIAYWSSSEHIATEAWYQIFGSTGYQLYCVKSTPAWLMVRPIRRF